MVILDFGGIKENVIPRSEYSIEHAREVLKDEIIATLGYGIQGSGQALNMKENGINVIVGQRKNSKSYNKALQDGWIP
ncbi:unnamed protein product, partial [marine sediment metagenome]